MKRTVSLILVLALGLATEVGKADFIFGEPANLGPVVNSPYDDGSPDISADGLLLYFDSLRVDGAGSWDIWLTRRETVDAEWGPSEPLGPAINSGYGESGPCILADGLTLYFASNRLGGQGNYDLWITRRQSAQEPWEEPVNLGPTVNSWAYDNHPSISADGLSLYFDSRRPNASGNLGNNDLYVTKRASLADDWGVPVNLGPAINTDQIQYSPNILPDGLTLLFDSRITDRDLWMTTRKSADDDWAPAVSLGPPMNTEYIDTDPSMWVDGCILYFVSTRPGGTGRFDIWQASIEPVVDLNGDGIVDAADMCIMVDNWGTDNRLCDIGPLPWGDGVVDVQDLVVLAEHLFEPFPPVATTEVNENDDGGQVELKLGQMLVVTLESNPTTGYRWEQAENPESILKQIGEAEFMQSETGDPPLVGAGGWEIFRFRASSAGQMTLQLVHHRPWEEGVEPLRTFSLQVIVP